MRKMHQATRRRGRYFGGSLAVALLAVISWQASAFASSSHASAASKTSSKAALAGQSDCHAVKRGGTLNYGVDQDVISFDAANTQDNGSLWADLNIYDQLVRLSPDGSKLVPDLAQSWDVKQGGRVIVFHLRKNAKFYDGTPVTSDRKSTRLNSSHMSSSY